MIDKRIIIAGAAAVVLAVAYGQGRISGKAACEAAQQEAINDYREEQAKLKREHQKELAELRAQLEGENSQAMAEFNEYLKREGNEKSRECVTAPIGGSVWLRK